MSGERALTVSEAMASAKRALETVSVHVIGEVSEFNDKPGYKAAYFTVADEDASMPCMMWKDAYESSGVELRCGALVEMWGTFSAYPPKGRMQFMVKRISLAGEGMLRMQVARLARRLEAEGLMRPERKRPLPPFPSRIAVVTSPRGKAVHDVIRTLRRRYPLAELLVAGVTVEGDSAVAEIVHGLEVAARARPDIILLVRGGGSYEDLMPFNSEEVARAVVASPVPVVTGIGHEPDTSIADMVSDLQASTPTAAAEACTASVEEIRHHLDRVSRALAGALRHRLEDAEHRVRRLASRPIFSDVDVLLGQAAQALDLVAASLRRAIPERLRRDRERLSYAKRSMLTIGPRLLKQAEDEVAMKAARLGDLSPLAILGRGYAVCFTEDGRTVVRSVEQVSEGDRLRLRVSDGHIGCLVEATEKETG